MISFEEGLYKEPALVYTTAPVDHLIRALAGEYFLFFSSCFRQLKTGAGKGIDGMTFLNQPEGGIEGEELVAVVVEICELTGTGIIEQVAIGTHTAILVLYRKVFFGDDGMGGGIDLYKLLIGNFPVQFA